MSRGKGSLQLWHVHHARLQPFKKHPKHGFYPWLKWHPKHITWVVSYTLIRNFSSCVKFHTLNKEYCVICPVILYPKRGSLFSHPKQGQIERKISCYIVCPVRAHRRLKWEKKWFLLSYLPISLIYLSFPSIWRVHFATLFSEFWYFWYPRHDRCISPLTMKKIPFLCIFAVAHGVQVTMWVTPLPDTVKRLYFCRGFNFVQRSNSKLLVASGNNNIESRMEMFWIREIWPLQNLVVMWCSQRKNKTKKTTHRIKWFYIIEERLLA